MYNLIKKYEGFSSKPYLCPAKIPTIGYGTTYYPDGSKVKMTDEPITVKQATDFLIWSCCNIKLPKGIFDEEQKEALYSLIYNVGQRSFDNSKCKRAIESADWETAFKEWNWIYCNGKISDGLVKRRNEEKILFFRNERAVKCS